VSRTPEEIETQVAGADGRSQRVVPLLTFSVAGTMIWMDSSTVLNGLSVRS
jgi:hypothetical protein